MKWKQLPSYLNPSLYVLAVAHEKYLLWSMVCLDNVSTTGFAGLAVMYIKTIANGQLLLLKS